MRPSRVRRLFAISTLAAIGLVSAHAGEPKHVVLDVPSMNCALCPLTVRKALERVPGVIEAHATYKPKHAEVTYDPDRVSPEALAKALGDAGYPATVDKP